jgi:hypothetical protein
MIDMRVGSELVVEADTKECDLISNSDGGSLNSIGFVIGLRMRWLRMNFGVLVLILSPHLSHHSIMLLK